MKVDFHNDIIVPIPAPYWMAGACWNKCYEHA